ncbi:unnamed protein product [Dicrocoelium dendriticum]|nr:unnamed protein product [Dicrocoelium dendriticum]
MFIFYTYTSNQTPLGGRLSDVIQPLDTVINFVSSSQNDMGKLDFENTHIKKRGTKIHFVHHTGARKSCGIWCTNHFVIAKYVSSLTEEMEKKLDNVLGRIEVPLDCRFSSIRTSETNIGNFLCDIIMTGVDAELTIINSGTFRADRIIPPGEFRLRDLVGILPMLDPLVLLEATGKQVLEALENGVSQYPKHEGRFPCVSGVRFSFDPSRPVGSRIPLPKVTIQGEPLHLDKNYRLCVKTYMASGKDGYDMLKECPVLVDEENGPIFSTLVQNYFRTILVLKGFERARTRHRQSIVTIADRRRLLELAGGPALPACDPNLANHWQRARAILIEQSELKSATCTAPTVDGRITVLHPTDS